MDEPKKIQPNIGQSTVLKPKRKSTGYRGKIVAAPVKEPYEKAHVPKRKVDN